MLSRAVAISARAATTPSGITSDCSSQYGVRYNSTRSKGKKKATATVHILDKKKTTASGKPKRKPVTIWGGNKNVTPLPPPPPKRTRKGSIVQVSQVPPSRLLRAQKRTLPTATKITSPVSLDVPRGQDRVKLNITVGDVVHGFKCVEKQFIPERNFTAYLFVHPCGAEHLHLECDDMENSFITAFKTLPTNSKGIPHVLEHTVLCGSKSFPVRDPFFNMQKRSLATYLNAFTSADATTYPFATQNVQDYYNLMAVYLDAMYFPSLHELDFMQEGHRLELVTEEEDAAERAAEEEGYGQEAEGAATEDVPEMSDATDSTATQKSNKRKKRKVNRTLKFKGVVYNEMKGAMDSNDIFYHKIAENLYPKSPYQYNFGGDPREIVKMTHDELLAFHKKFYHPSNSRTVTYGDLPIEPTLQFIGERASEVFKQKGEDTPIPDEPRWTKPRTATVYGPLSPIGDPEKQTKMSVTWLCGPSSVLYENFCMQLLSALLATGPSSPMYQALITSGLGAQYAPGTGYYFYKDGTFSVGLSDISAASVDTIEKTIYETIKKAHAEGFPQERIDSLLHQIELDTKHVDTEVGVNIGSIVTQYWAHGVSPIAVLKLSEYLDRLRRELASGRKVFQDLIEKYLINNQHRLTLTMKPSESYLSDQVKAEEKDLMKLAPYFKGKAGMQLRKIAKTLRDRQSAPPQVHVLPKINVADVSRSINTTTRYSDPVDGVPATWIPQATNGIGYFRAKISLDELPEHLVPFVPLFNFVLTKLGAGDMDYKQLAQRIEATTGGLAAHSKVVDSPFEHDKFSFDLSLTSHALESNTEAMFSLWQQVLNETRWNDYDRLKVLIEQIKTRLHDSLLEDGYVHARTFASARIIPAYRLREVLSGVSQYQLVKKISEEQNFDDLTAKFKAIAEFAAQKSTMRVAINSEAQLFNRTKGALADLLSALPSVRTGTESTQGAVTHYHSTQIGESRKTFFGLPIQINHVAHALRTVPYVHEDYSAIDVMGQVLSSNYIHNEVREKGGAYGGSSSQNNGAFVFSSYRDPNVPNTLSVFKGALDWIESGKFTDDNIEEAKLSLFASLDGPEAPSRKGLQEFEYGIPDEARQKRRDGLFSTDRKKVVQVARKYLAKDALFSVAVFGAQESASQFTVEDGWQVRSE